MSPLKKIFYKTGSCFSMKFLQKISPVTTLFPYHHTVSNDKLPHIHHLYPYKNIAQFKEDINILLKHNKPISAYDLLQCLAENKPFPKKTFLLSFDDGFREIYDTIAPILESMGLPAIFFINPAFIDNKELFFRCKTSLLIDCLLKNTDTHIIKEYRHHLNLPGSTTAKIISKLKEIKFNSAEIVDELAHKINYSFDDFLKTNRPFLTTDNLLSLKKRGFTIGAHSMNHPYYEQLNLTQQLDQTVSSCNYVQQNTTMDKQFFSFPYTDENLPQNLFDELKKTSIDLLFGVQNQKEELNNKMVHRFNAERPVIKFDHQLKGILLMAAINKSAGTNKVKRL